MLRVVESARLRELSPQMVLASLVIEGCYRDAGVYECWITSANDSRHMAGSLHYTGRALDFRTKNVPVDKRPALVAKIKASLPDAEYDIVWEAQGLNLEHLHCEWDPK